MNKLKKLIENGRTILELQTTQYLASSAVWYYLKPSYYLHIMLTYVELTLKMKVAELGNASFSSIEH